MTKLLLIITILLLPACTTTRARIAPTPAEPRLDILAEGLLGPLGLAALPDGGLLVAEAGTGEKDDSGGVTLITVEGEVGRLISDLPSSRDAGDLAGVNTVALSPGQDKIYLGNFGAGHLWTLPLTPEQQTNGLLLPESPLTTDDLTPVMSPLNRVQLTNPFDITFDAEGVPVVSDASGNGVAKETAEGATRFIHRFDLLRPADGPTIEPVPTGLTRVGEEYYVTLTGGCPYPAGGGQLVAIDEARNQRTIVDSLNMPIDIAQGPDGTLWLLEFARFTPDASCFSGEGYQPDTGRLSRLQANGSLETILDGLNFPGAVLPLADGRLVISEVFTGRVVRVTVP